jgi:SHS2 domain-containing protein
MADELFREFDHTGDLGIELQAPTRKELFRRACIALAQILVSTETVSCIEDREIRVFGDSDVDLMHDLLTALLNLFVADAFIWKDARVDEAEGSLTAHVCGEAFDRSRHEFRTEIKAITYHELAIEKKSDLWRARVIFDV